MELAMQIRQSSGNDHNPLRAHSNQTQLKSLPSNHDVIHTWPYSRDLDVTVETYFQKTRQVNRLPRPLEYEESKNDGPESQKLKDE